MKMHEQITSIEERVRGAGHSLRELCDEAGIAQTTWGRWKRGVVSPNTRTWARVEEAAERLAKPDAA